MARYTDSFNRADTASGSGLGSIPNGGPAWQVVSGLWRILSNRAVSDTAATSNPIVVVASGAGDGDVSVSTSPSGGDAIYGRVQDANNWIRARIRQYQTSNTTTYYVTEYEWACVTQSGSAPVTEYEWYVTYSTSPHSSEGDLYGLHTEYRWNTVQPVTSSTMVHAHYWGNDPNSDATNHSHTKVSEGKTGNTRTKAGTGYTYSTSYSWSASNASSPCGSVYDAYTTGNTRQAGPYYTTQYFDNYQVVLEKNVNGAITPLGTADVNPPSSLRLRAVGSSLQVFVSGSTSAAISATDGHMATVNRFGIGRGAPTTGSGSALDNFDFDSLNTAPNAPIPLAPVNNETVDVTSSFRISWQFSDPDTGDSQSYAYVYTKPFGGAYGAAIAVPNPNSFLDIPAGTFPAGQRVWYVTTKDQSGSVSPPSAESTFTLANPPAGPVWTNPVNGGTASEITNATWSVSEQDAYEIRRMSDDLGTEYWNSGVVESSTARSQAISFPEQGRFERLQIRVRVGTAESGLWSSWTSIRLNVTYTPPEFPTTVASPDASNARVVVSSIHPSGGIAVATQVYQRREYGGTFWETLWGSDGLAPGASWSDLFAAPGTRYEYRTIAVASTGSTAIGLPTLPVSVDTPKYWLRDPDTGEGRVVHISDFPEIDRPREAIVFEPLDSQYPIVEYGQTRSARGEFTIKTADEDELEWLMSKLEAGRSLVLLMPAERDYGRGDVLWFAPLRHPSRRLYAGKNPARLVPIQFVEVAPR